MEEFVILTVIAFLFLVFIIGYLDFLNYFGFGADGLFFYLSIKGVNFYQIKPFFLIFFFLFSLLAL